MKITSLLGTQLATFLVFTQVLFASPLVMNVSPNFGPTAGGSTVTITGSGFTGVTAVDFGTIPASFTFNSDTSITVTSPLVNNAGNFHVTVTAGTTSIASNADFFTFQGNWLAIVTDSDENLSGTVTAIDLTTLIQTNLPLNVCSGEQDRLAITPDATMAYISNDFGSDVVVPFDITTLTALTSITVDAGGTGIAITPDGTTAYTVDSNGTVDVIDLATNTVTTSITIDNTESLLEIAITPDGTQAYITGTALSRVYFIDILTNTYTPGAFFNVSGTPQGIISAPTPAYHTVYVAISNGPSSAVLPINTSTNTLGTLIPVGNGDPLYLAITADNTQIFVCDNLNNTVIPIDVATQTAGTPIPL